MRALSVFAMIALLAVVSACKSDSKVRNPQEIPSTEETDSTVVKNYTFKSYHVEKADSLRMETWFTQVSFSADYPLVTEPETAQLVDSISSWITGKSGVKLLAHEAADQVVKGYIDEAREEFTQFIAEGEPMPISVYETTADFKLLTIEPKFVTYQSTIYLYRAGAHGFTTTTGATFIVPTGERVTYDNLFTPESDDALVNLVARGIMEQYFQVTDVNEFRERLLLGDDRMELPAAEPMLLAEGVKFVYQQYEIASYAQGMPECVIPYDMLRPYFTEFGLELVDSMTQ